ncbi:MAG: hypothetical protein PHZ14_06865, partial [Sulfuricella sp.]|nr:hypothetical protein [Sulfuricella sp.]
LIARRISLRHKAKGTFVPFVLPAVATLKLRHIYADLHSRQQASRDLLRKEKYAVEWHEYPMAHSVCSEEIADIGIWLTRIFAA